MKIEQSKLNEYLKKIHGSVCPLCGNNHWNISDQVFQAIEFDYKGIAGGVDPFSDTHFDVWYGEELYVATSIDEVMSVKLFDGKSLTEIVDEIEEVDGL